MRATLKIILFAATVSSLVFTAPAIAGAVYEKDWDPLLYGGLDQHSTVCPDLACGPSAAVNSFVFLQNLYPDIYGDSLAGSNYETWVDTANTLLDPRYMNCDCGNGGTDIANFISGKENYFADVLPGTTTVHFQNVFDAANPTKPTWQFLYDELMHGEDIEILVGFYDETGRNGGHYVTVSGFDFNDVNGDGEVQNGIDENATLSFIDPDDGHAHQSLLDTKDGFLDLLDYSDKYDTFIEAAVAESPIHVPEPMSLSLFGAGLIGAFALRRRQSSL